MSSRILEIIQKEAPGLQCLPCDKVNLDFERFIEYRDSDEHPAQTPFEIPSLPFYKKRVITNSIKPIPSILRYFLDASRRTYKIADIIKEGRYLPLVSGQIGVAVVERNCKDGTKPLTNFCSLKNVIVFPEKVDDQDILNFQEKINQSARKPFILLKYRIKKEKELIDLAIAKIMSEMQNLEILTMLKMTEQGLLENDSLLVIDGPLRFRKRFDITQFRNVIGLSKSFRPSFTIGKGLKKIDVGTLTSSLRFGERTTVYRTTDEEITIGMWYLRIRDHKKVNNPLQGIVKIECYATSPEEKENGFEADRIDTISHHIINERNVTPYKSDIRWASHIYPIYLAEKYVKSSMINDTVFKALF